MTDNKLTDNKLTDNEIIPISLKQANEYVTVYHRHHKAVQGIRRVFKRFAGVLRGDGHEQG